MTNAQEFLKDDPSASVLLGGMITGWQFYFLCHNALLMHAMSKFSGDSAQVIADTAAQAARNAALDHTNINPETVETTITQIMLPILEALKPTKNIDAVSTKESAT